MAKKPQKPFAIRYPRESVPRPVTEGRALSTIPIGSWETLSDGDDVAILATGTMVEAALSAVTMLSEQGCTASVINARFVKPMDLGVLQSGSERYYLIVTIEENVVAGGFGASVASYLADRLRPQQRVINLGIPDRFVEHGPRGMLLEEVGLSPEGIARTILRHHPKPQEQV